MQTGETIRDRYVIKQIIGRGGMGSIYLAEDNRLSGRMCALKEVVHGQELTDDIKAQGREQFYQEASVLARLDHPNLPKVSDYFTEHDRDYLVMDFVPGQDLKSLMEQARKEERYIALDEALQWSSQIMDALAYLHAQDPPVIHRDIKPSNLKLTPNGLIKLVDFGLVKQMVPDEMTITVIQGRGTANYTPLEQYGGDTGHTDPRSDIYALGATLYHLLTNVAPIEAKQRFLNPNALVPPNQLNPSISPVIEQSLLWAMELHPDERPDDIETLRSALLQGITSRSALPLGQSLWNMFENQIDRALGISALVLFVVAILASAI
jgi:serine/threonine-protein kinase